jgi:hypothetical protein
MYYRNHPNHIWPRCRWIQHVLQQSPKPHLVTLQMDTASTTAITQTTFGHAADGYSMYYSNHPNHIWPHCRWIQHVLQQSPKPHLATLQMDTACTTAITQTTFGHAADGYSMYYSNHPNHMWPHCRWIQHVCPKQQDKYLLHSVKYTLPHPLPPKRHNFNHRANQLQWWDLVKVYKATRGVF